MTDDKKKSVGERYTHAVFQAAYWQRQAKVLGKFIEGEAIAEADFRISADPLPAPRASIYNCVLTQDQRARQELVSVGDDAVAGESVEVATQAEAFRLLGEELQFSGKFPGICSRIAKQLSVSPQHVREVFLRRRVSDRVSKALDAELKKIEGTGRAA